MKKNNLIFVVLLLTNFISYANFNMDYVNDIRPIIRLGFDSAISTHRQLLVGLEANSTNLIDIGYDAPMIDVHKDDMYWEISEGKFVIQGVPNFDAEQIIPLGLVIDTDGIIYIKIDALENISDDTDIYIYDNVIDTYYNIRKSDFRIILTKGEYNNRFSLRFKNNNLSVTKNNNTNSITAFYNNSTKKLNILNNELNSSINSVFLYNILGQTISSWDTHQKGNQIIEILIENLNSAIYIAKIKTDEGELSVKFIVK